MVQLVAPGAALASSPYHLNSYLLRSLKKTFPGPTFWPKLFWQVLGQVWAWEGRGCGDTCNMANLIWPRLEGLRCFWNHHFLIPGVDSNHTTPMWNLAGIQRSNVSSNNNQTSAPPLIVLTFDFSSLNVKNEFQISVRRSVLTGCATDFSGGGKAIIKKLEASFA